MREKVGKSRNTVFFQWFAAPEGRKVGSLKRRVRSQLARWEMKKCTPLWREANFQVKMYKTHQLRTTFGSWDVEKVHAVVARSTFQSQNVQNTPAPDHFWKLRCRKSARRCGAKQISKSNILKTPGVRTTFGGSDVKKVHAVVARSKFRSQNVKNTRGSDHFWRFRCRFAWQAQGMVHLVKSEPNVSFVAFSTTTATTPHYTPIHYIQLHSITLHYITLHYTPLPYITLRYTTFHYTTLHYLPLHYITLHYTTFHYTSLHYTPLHSTTLQLQLHNYTPLHSTTLNYTTLHFTTLPSTTLHYTPQHYNYNYSTTLHYTKLHSTTLNYSTLHYTTLHYTTLHWMTLHHR